MQNTISFGRVPLASPEGWGSSLLLLALLHVSMEGPFVDSCQASKKGMGIYFTLVFILEEMSGKWSGPYRHSLWCILCHHTSTLVCDVLAWKRGQKLCHRENGSHVAKTRGLDYTYAGAKRSAMIYWRNTITYLLSPLLQKCFLHIKI